MRILRNIVSLAAGVLLGCMGAAAGAPAGYYDAAENKCGRELLAALNSKIGTHTNVGYDGLLSLYRTSDVHPNGKIWDMYSTKEWNYGTTCGNYSYVGDCYNREHSFPKSWFDNGSPMASDAFHIYPTDGKVNGQRSNYPYGECANGTYLASHNGVRPLGKLGKSTFPGYSGTVFEPDDEYKGDFARSYFYMAAAYYTRIGSWHSDMLAGNNFPAFRPWAINLLLKWHRQDPVSEKEINRNDVVYGRQRNRNPFIDYPELAEHIWGNKSTIAWTPNGPAEPEIMQPAEGTSVDFGTTAAGVAIERNIYVRTTNATEPTFISFSGAGFSSAVTSLTAAATNGSTGTRLTLTYRPTAVGASTGTMTLSCGDLTRTVSLSGNCVDGLPAGPAIYITDESFTATWVYIGDATGGNYTLDVRTGGASIEGYPRLVASGVQSYNVTGLEPSTTYTYTVSSASQTSRPVTVTTADPIPSIEFLFDGDLYFTAAPGEPSEAAELLMESENLEGDITVTVTAPFQVSANNSDWSGSVVVPEDQDRVYLRMYAANAGTYTGQLTAASGSYTAEAIEIRGIASIVPDFCEDFEQDASGFGSYNPMDAYQGTAAKWNFSNVGIWSSDPAHSGEQSVRFGKNPDSYIEMAEDRTGGIGTVSFFAKYWGSESNPVIDVQYSTDGGQSYRTAGSVTVSGTTYAEYSVFVGCAGKARVRLQQTSGSRLNLDDVSITRYSSGVSDPSAERHSWDAFCRGGELIVTVETDGLTFGVYALDGTTIHYGVLTEGEHSFGSLAPGLYIVACGDFARRVVIR